MIGIWALIVFMIVSFGGTYLALPSTISGLFNAIAPTRDLRTVRNTRITPQKGRGQNGPW